MIITINKEMVDADAGFKVNIESETTGDVTLNARVDSTDCSVVLNWHEACAVEDVVMKRMKEIVKLREQQAAEFDPDAAAEGGDVLSHHEPRS